MTAEHTHPRELTLGGEVTVRRIGVGTLRIMNAGPERGRAVLARAAERGVNLIDTADAYAGGEVELLIAEALYPYPEGLVIATKGGQVSVDGEPRPDCRPEHLRKACEASLKRLRLERIDLYQLHNPDPRVPLEEALGALVELRDEGKVRQIGISNLYGPDFERAIELTGAASAQNPYNVSQRISQAELDFCEREGLPFLAYFPLDGGALARPGGPLAGVAEHRGMTPAQVALAWLLQTSTVTLPIPCTSSIDHLEENLRSEHLRLSPDELALIDGGIE